MEISALLNVYLQKVRIDNTLFQDDRSVCDTAIGFSVNCLYLIASMVYPFMPSTAQSMTMQLQTHLQRSLEGIESGWDGMDIYPGHVIGKQAYLFKKIDEGLEEGFRLKYGGGMQLNNFTHIKDRLKAKQKLKK